MTLCRVISHFRNQEWTAIFLDFLIVVVGVFVGLQVQQWNETRIARSEEHSYLQRLYQDVSASIAESNEEQATRTRQAKQATLVLESLAACKLRPADRDAFAQGLYTLGKFGSTQFVRTTFDELKSTGKFEVIANVELRKRLVALANQIEIHTYATSTMQARIAPHILYVETNVGFNVTAPIGGNGVFFWRDLDLDFAQVCTDRRFALAVSAIRNYTYTWIGWGDGLTGEMEAIRAMLETELGGDHMVKTP
jgi:hypothetical protein